MWLDAFSSPTLSEVFVIVASHMGGGESVLRVPAGVVNCCIMMSVLVSVACR